MQDATSKSIESFHGLNVLDFNVLVRALLENLIKLLMNLLDSHLGLKVPLTIELRCLDEALSLFVITLQDNAISRDLTAILELKYISDLQVLEGALFKPSVISINLGNALAFLVLVHAAESNSWDSVSLLVFLVPLALSQELKQHTKQYHSR